MIRAHAQEQLLAPQGAATTVPAAPKRSGTVYECIAASNSNSDKVLGNLAVSCFSRGPSQRGQLCTAANAAMRAHVAGAVEAATKNGIPLLRAILAALVEWASGQRRTMMCEQPC